MGIGPDGYYAYSAETFFGGDEYARPGGLG